MEAQMKRGFLEACVLAAVSGEESYGYQIVKDVPASMGLTESTLYPLLKRLEKAGCITARSAEHNGRLRPVLPHHGRRASTHRGVPGRVAVRTGDLRIR